MKIVLRLLSISSGLIALLFWSSLMLGALAATGRGRVSDFVQVVCSLIAMILTLRCIVWLWSGPQLWSVRKKRAEVRSFVALTFAWLASAFFVPAEREDAHAVMIAIAVLAGCAAYTLTWLTFKPQSS